MSAALRTGSEAFHEKRDGLRRALLPLGLVLALFLSLVPLVGAFAPAFAEAWPGPFVRAFSSPAIGSAFSFSLGQALASTILAMLLGLPGAWLVSRFQFRGRKLLKALSAIPFCVPPALVVLAFVLYFGREGFANRALMAVFGLGKPPLDILYSPAGVVLVHAFYNFPIAMSLLSGAFESLPPERVQAARTLGAGRLRIAFDIILPDLLPALAAAFSLIFLYCFTSFIIVLVFGGPGRATVEMEIYRLARSDLDKAAASALALAETAIGLILASVYSMAESASRSRGGSPVSWRRGPLGKSRPAKALLSVYAPLLLAFLAGPLLALLVSAFTVREAGGEAIGLGNFAALLLEGERPLISASLATLVVSASAAAVALSAALSAALSLEGRASKKLRDWVLMVPLALSGVVAAFGWSSVLGNAGPAAVVAAQAALGFPFALRLLSASLAGRDRRLVPAARCLGASPSMAARTITLPIIAGPAATAFAFCFAIAAGDAASLLVIPTAGFQNLSLMIYRLAGSYRFGQACAAGIVLAAMATAAFAAVSRGDDAPGA